MKSVIYFLFTFMIFSGSSLIAEPPFFDSTVRDQSKVSLAPSALIEDLVSYFKLDERSGNAIDARSKNDGTIHGVVQGKAGVVGNSYSFSGSSNININAVLSDVGSSTRGTLSAWVNPDWTPYGARVILSFGDTNAKESIRLFQFANGKLGIALTRNGSHRWRIETTSAILSRGVWSHIVVVQDGKPAIYVNGVRVSQSYTVSTDLDDWFANCSGIDNARIGTLNAENSGESLGWNGRIDEVGIWNRSLTMDEITGVYNSGDAYVYPFESVTDGGDRDIEDGVQVEKRLGGGSGAPKGFLQYLPDDYSSTSSLYPTIIFLHGAGERGNGTNELNRVDNQGIPFKIASGWNAEASGEKFIVLSPQQSTSYFGWIGNPKDKIPNDALEFALWALNESGLRIDPARLYLTGLSMGTPWSAAGFEGNINADDYSNIFAAIAPVSAGGAYAEGQMCGKRRIPVWAFHGGADSAVPISEGQRPINGFNSVGGTPIPRLTVYPSLGHSGAVWNERAYSTDHSYHNPNLFEWFLTHTKPR